MHSLQYLIIDFTQGSQVSRNCTRCPTVLSYFKQYCDLLQITQKSPVFSYIFFSRIDLHSIIMVKLLEKGQLKSLKCVFCDITSKHFSEMIKKNGNSLFLIKSRGPSIKYTCTQIYVLFLTLTPLFLYLIFIYKKIININVIIFQIAFEFYSNIGLSSRIFPCNNAYRWAKLDPC